MPIPVAEPKGCDTVSIEVECTDCGHTRWLRPAQLWTFGVRGDTPLTALAERLSCSHCRRDGLPGKSIAVQAAFATEQAAAEANRWRALRTQEAPGAGSRARVA